MRQASMQEAVGGHIEYHLDSVYTSLPAVVVNVHNSFNDLRIDVQPSVNVKYRNGTSREHPVILNVPVQMPSSSTSAILFPLNKGDTVLLVFSQRGLDTFKSGNGLPATPTDFRKFDKRDAVAIPGVWSFSKSPNHPDKHTLPHSTEDMVVVHNLGTAQECEVRLKLDGSIKLSSSLKVDIDSPEVNISNDLNVGGATTVVGALEASTVKSTTNNVTLHTHKHSVGGTPPVAGT